MSFCVACKFPKYSRPVRNMFPFDVLNLELLYSLFWKWQQAMTPRFNGRCQTAIDLQKRKCQDICDSVDNQG